MVGREGYNAEAEHDSQGRVESEFGQIYDSDKDRFAEGITYEGYTYTIAGAVMDGHQSYMLYADYKSIDKNTVPAFITIDKQGKVVEEKKFADLAPKNVNPPAHKVLEKDIPTTLNADIRKRLGSRLREDFQVFSRVLSKSWFLEAVGKREYSTIIGIDASARIPALFVNGFLKRAYDDGKATHASLRFFAGGAPGHGRTNVTEAEFEEQKEKIIEQLKRYPIRSGKVLVVESVIASGNSIVPLTRALRELGFEFDIISVAQDDRTDMDQIRKNLGANHADAAQRASTIYTEKDIFISGVQKEYGDVLARRADVSSKVGQDSSY